MSWSRRHLLRGGAALGVAALLAGCGFQPLYGTGPDGTGVADALNGVAISNIPDRHGQQLRNLLIDRFYATAPAADMPYRLDVTLTAAEQKLAMRKDASTLRAQLVITTPYRLVETATGKTVLVGSARSLIAYSELDERYGALTNVNNAYERGLIQVADDITRRVATRLGRDEAAAKDDSHKDGGDEAPGKGG